MGLYKKALQLYSIKIVFSSLPKVDIVIYDEVNSNFIEKIIGERYSIKIFKVRPIVLYFSFKIFTVFFKLFYKLDIKFIVRNKRGMLIGFLLEIRRLYVLACLISMKPKAIVSLIDNSEDYHWLSKNCKSFPFIAIQNGSRLKYALIEHTDFYLQHYFCFGTHEKKLFSQIGIKVENYYPVGSLVASLAFKPKEYLFSKCYDILVISCWRGNIGFSKEVRETMKSMHIMDELLSKYLHEKNLKAAIILRSEEEKEHWYMPDVGMTELEYYKGLYPEDVEIIKNQLDERNIYPLLQQSNLLISCLSSALIEGFGIGKKALFCNFTGTDEYHLDFDPAIVTTDSSYENFSKQLDALLDMAQQDYNYEYRKLQQYYMHFPERKTTHELIADTIDDIITCKQ